MTGKFCKKVGKMDEKLFTLHINCFAMHEVKCNGVIYRQILFDGEAKGALFNGKILPGGVDTQIIKEDGTGTLSARYMLEGVDLSGNECRVYIDNSGVLGSDSTKPLVYSDSKEFDVLKEKELKGKMVTDEEGFKIIIYMERMG